MAEGRPRGPAIFPLTKKKPTTSAIMTSSKSLQERNRGRCIPCRQRNGDELSRVYKYPYS